MELKAKQDYLNTLFEALPEYTTNEMGDISNLFRNKTFQKVIKDFLRIKAEFIADEIEDQEDLNKIRYTRKGNKEILELAELFDTYYQDKIKEEKEV